MAFDSAANRYIADGHLGLVRKALQWCDLPSSRMSLPLAFPGDPIRSRLLRQHLRRK